MVRTKFWKYLDTDKGRVKYVVCNGESTDEKPTRMIATGSKFTEVDTGDKYEFSEKTGTWIKQPKEGGGGGGGAVDDVKINGASIVNQGVANIPVAGSAPGVVKTNTELGISTVTSGTNAGAIRIVQANSTEIKNGVEYYRPIVPESQHRATFYGLAKAAGDSTQSASSNPVGTYTDGAKSAIQTMLDAPESVSGTTPSITALPGVRYVCGEVATITIVAPASGIIDVVFESGSTPAVLTVTPPTGKTMQWPDWFDPTDLDANATYEINIMDGNLGAVMVWA